MSKLTVEEIAELILAKTLAGEAHIVHAEETADAPSVAQARMLAFFGNVRNPRFYQIVVLDTTAPKKLTADESFQLAERMATTFTARMTELAGKATNNDDTLRALCGDLLAALKNAGALKDSELVMRAKRHGVKVPK